MSWAPISWTPEEPDPEPPEAVMSPATPMLPPEGLLPSDYTLLGKMFEGKRGKAIAQEMGLSTATVKKRMERPAFLAAVKQVEAGSMERVARGDFGALAIFKSQAVGAARRLVRIAKHSLDDRVKFQANLALLKLGGVREPEPMRVESPERIIDAMTAEELDAFTKDGVFPERFSDQLARLTTASMQKADRRRWEAQVVDEQMDAPPEEPTVREVEETWD